MVLFRRRHSSAGGLGGRGTDGGGAIPTSAAGGPGLAEGRDDDLAQESQQFRDGDRDQPGVRLRARLVLAFQGDGNSEVGVGEQADRGPAVPRFQRITCPASRPVACLASW
jgi:hypothetical protein